MDVFVAGASGAVGRRLVPALVGAGHRVTGMTRTPGRAGLVRAMGAAPVVADALDRRAVTAAVASAAPEVVVHQLTAIGPLRSLRRFDQAFAPTNRLRTEGTDNLISAARTTGARRLVAQSFAGWPYAREGGPVKGEDDRLDPDPPAPARQTHAAIRYLETAVLGAEDVDGLVLRYGFFYGPGTSIAVGGEQVEAVRRRRFPVVGGGGGVWSFTHVDDAASATVAAIERRAVGVLNAVDDEPGPVAEWLPELAAALGAKPPRRVPAWLGRLAIGDFGMALMTEIRGASNARAKRELGWRPAYPSWREGFRTGLAG